VTLARCPSCEHVFEVPGTGGCATVVCPACGAEFPCPPCDEPSETYSMGPVPATASSGGEFFGQYELISKLGASDVAVSYRARDSSRGAIVVLKVLAPGRAATREEIACMIERARRARTLDHPGIAKLLDIGQVDGTDYLASEFVEGRSLASAAEGGALQVGEAVELVGTVAEALDFAHSRGAVHGNLKPSNVIVDDRGRPRLVDFGLAREFWRLGRDGLKAACSSGGPPPWHMAPEQLRGEEPTARSDVYGLGAVLYHVLARKPPHQARTLLELALLADRGVASPPSAANLRVPPAVDAIVMKCLERDPAHRFSSAGELASEIDRFMRGQKLRASSPGPMRRLARTLRARSRSVFAVGLAAALAALAAHVAAGRLRGAADRPDARALAAIDEAVELGAKGLWDEGVKRLSEVSALEGLSENARSRLAACVGVAELRRGRPAAAAEALRRALSLRPLDAELHYLLGIALWHARTDAREVARELGEALRLDPARGRSARFQYEYGRACEEAGLTTEAAAAFARVAEIDPAYKPELVRAHLARCTAGSASEPGSSGN